jgi:carboxyl-terminal processing protease
LAFVLAVSIVAPLCAKDVDSTTPDKVTKAFKPIVPGATDGQIAFITARMLEQNHYLRQKFDDTVSSKLLDHYIEALDPQHSNFLQTDIRDFERYRTNLDDMTASKRSADTTPACEIFNRFMKRLQQRIDYVDEVLQNEQFSFNGDERITINRRELPYPTDLAAAKQLWLERLKFEYLQEKLAKKPKAKSDSAQHEGEKQTATKPKTEKEEIVDTLTRRYHRNLRAFIDWNNEDVLQVYLTTLAHVYDPHSDYFGRAQLESFAIGMNLSLFGIGAELVSEDGYCTIRRLLPGGPAEKSKKIKEKDRIIGVAQGDQPFVDVVEMTLSKAVQMIRGPKGTTVRLNIIPAGADASATTTLTLVRDEIKLEDAEAKAKIIEMPREKGDALRLGVIDLPSFYAPLDVGSSRRIELANNGTPATPKTTTADVSKLINKLKQQHVSGLILDLRRNGGGSLEEAIRLTGLFIKKGPVVQVRNYKDEVEVMDDEDSSVLYDGPLIVLTSRFSASASEILAGALQDYGRALVVGDASTHGKGTVQSVNPLAPHMQVDKNSTNDPGALKITIKKFYRASGASTQKKGVVPDIVLPSIFNDSKDVGESSLDNPLEWDVISSASYESWNMVNPFVPELRERSAKRIASDREFDYIREDIEQYHKIQNDKTLSLNEAQRVKEKEDLDARQKARDKERLARKDSPDKVYEITLKLADKPGLPAPVEKTNSVTKLASKGPSSVSVNPNSASVVPSKGTPGIEGPKASGENKGTAEDGDDAEDEKPAAVDAILIEAEHILVDYLSVLPKHEVLTAGKSQEKSAQP